MGSLNINIKTMLSVFWGMRCFEMDVKAFSRGQGSHKKKGAFTSVCVCVCACVCARMRVCQCGELTCFSFLMLWLRNHRGWGQLTQDKDACRFGGNLPGIHCNHHFITQMWGTREAPLKVATDRHGALTEPPTAPEMPVSGFFDSRLLDWPFFVPSEES